MSVVNSYKRRPLWLQLLVGLSVLGVLVAVLGGDYVRTVQRGQLLESSYTEAQKTLELLSAATLEATLSEDIPQLNSIVGEMVGKEQDLVAVEILNEQRQVLIRWQAPGMSQADRLLSYSDEIRLEGEVFGFIEVAMDMRSRYEAIEAQVDLVRLLVMALVVLLAGLVLLLMHRLVVKPLSDIDAGIRCLKRGDVAVKLDVHMSQDLALVAESINALAEALRHEEDYKRALLETKEAAEEASRAKTLFLSSMSHELRTPMNAILGFAQLMESDPNEPLAEPHQEAVAEILIAGRHLMQLINEVLDMARIESGRMDVKFSSLDLNRVLAEVLALMAPQAAEAGIELLCDDDLGHELVGQGDYLRLKQVLLNLISNAIKYNKPQGLVRVHVDTKSEQLIRVVVEDTGPGLDKDQQQRVFEPFTRLNESHNIEGTGIGLTISHRLMHLMKGNIGVESELGQGSRFWVEIQRHSDL